MSKPHEPREYEWSSYYRQGRRAFAEGKKLSACPLVESATGKTWHINAWKMGWRAASEGMA